MPSAPTPEALRLQMHHDVARWVTKAVREAAQELATQTHSAASPVDHASLADLMTLMGRRETSFAAHLTASIRNKLVEACDLAGDTAIMPILPAGPELLTSDDVDDSIAQARAVNEIEWQAEQPLAELVARASRLRELHETHPQANPLSPGTVVRALMRSVRSLGLSGAARRFWLVCVGQALARQLPAVYAQHAQWLRDAGVAALVDGQQPVSGWDVPSHVRQPTPNQALQQLVAWGQQMTAGTATAGGLRILDEPVSLRARDDIMDLLFNHMRAQMAAKPAVQVMITRLQASARRLAASDPGLWRSLDHPLWRLIERILCTATVTALDDVAVTALHAAIERTLQALNASTSLDKRRLGDEVERLEFEVTGVMAASGERLTPRGAELQARARKEEWIGQLREQLQQQFEQAQTMRGAQVRAVPAPVQRFLREEWAEVLYSASALGNDSLARCAAVVDDLITCTTRAPGTALPEPTLRGLMMRVREGLQAANLPPVQQDAALRTLMPMLQRPEAAPAGSSPARAPVAAAPSPGAAAGSRAPSGPSTAETPGTPATPATPPPSDMGVLHAALPTVPIGIVAGSPHSQRADADCRRWLAGVRAGDRLRIHLDAAWTSAVVRWRSADAAVFVLVTQQPSGQHSLTRRALEQLRKAGLVATLERGELLARVFVSLMGSTCVRRPASAVQADTGAKPPHGTGGAAAKSLTSGMTVTR